MDNKMIAYCGIVCTECPAFEATQKNDDAKRREVAEAWTKQYNMSIKPEDVNCDGCKSEGKRFGYCNICQIRKCALGRGVENCAYCGEYACDNLTSFISMVPHAKTTLEEIRKNR